MSNRKPPQGGSPKGLTEAERAILRALRDGLTPSEVARALKRSELTVRTHIRNARAKLELRATDDLRKRLAAGEFAEAIAEPEPPAG